MLGYGAEKECVLAPPLFNTFFTEATIAREKQSLAVAAVMDIPPAKQTERKSKTRTGNEQGKGNGGQKLWGKALR